MEDIQNIINGFQGGKHLHFTQNKKDSLSFHNELISSLWLPHKTRRYIGNTLILYA